VDSWLVDDGELAMFAAANAPARHHDASLDAVEYTARVAGCCRLSALR
jgi:hypothetical protein